MTKRHAIRDERTIRALTPDTKLTQLTDGQGLYLKLRFKPGQLHSWCFDFKSPATGKRNTLALGDFPHIPLKKARDRAEELRAMVAQGQCPAVARDAAKVNAEQAREHAERVALGLPGVGTFKAATLEFRALRWQEEPTKGFKNQWSDTHGRKWLRLLENHVFPILGDRMCTTITAAEFLGVVAPLDGAGQHQTAQNVRIAMQQVMDYATVKGWCAANPVHSIKVVLQRGFAKGNFASCTTPDSARELMRALAADTGTNQDVRDCTELHALTWQRPGNVRAMRWDEIDFAASRWVIPSAKMKRSVTQKEKGADHVVPLARQALALLREIKARREAKGITSDYVFPAKPGFAEKYMGRNNVQNQLYRLGFDSKMTAHGFRAMARTLLVDVHKLDSRPLEANLAHSNGETLGTSYDRATYMQERIHAVQVWADYLDELRSDAQPVHLKAA
jgi:integrase